MIEAGSRGLRLRSVESSHGAIVYSRAAQTDSDGFYYQPAGLCEDYPEETTTSAKIAADFDVLRDTGTKLLRFGPCCVSTSSRWRRSGCRSQRGLVSATYQKTRVIG